MKYTVNCKRFFVYNFEYFLKENNVQFTKEYNPCLNFGSYDFLIDEVDLIIIKLKYTEPRVLEYRVEKNVHNKLPIF